MQTSLLTRDLLAQLFEPEQLRRIDFSTVQMLESLTVKEFSLLQSLHYGASKVSRVIVDEEGLVLAIVRVKEICRDAELHDKLIAMGAPLEMMSNVARFDEEDYQEHRRKLGVTGDCNTRLATEKERQSIHLAWLQYRSLSPLERFVAVGGAVRLELGITWRVLVELVGVEELVRDISSRCGQGEVS